jgi:hypothetical protein
MRCSTPSGLFQKLSGRHTPADDISPLHCNACAPPQPQPTDHHRRSHESAPLSASSRDGLAPSRGTRCHKPFGRGNQEQSRGMKKEVDSCLSTHDNTILVIRRSDSCAHEAWQEQRQRAEEFGYDRLRGIFVVLSAAAVVYGHRTALRT